MRTFETSPLITIRNENRHNKTTELSLIFSIICIVDVFGVFPVVTLPKAIIDCGFYGILVISIVCCGQMYTAILLGKCWSLAKDLDPDIESKNRYPYSALAEFTFGPVLAKFVSILLDITVFGGGIPNLIVASQNLELLGFRISDSNLTISYCFWIIVIGGILCPILWLGSPKDMKLLCSVSVSLVVLVFILLTGCLIFSKTPEQNPDDNSESEIEHPLWEYIFIAYGIVSFQFDIHPSILTIQVDMKDKSKLNLAVIGGFSMSLIMFGVVAVISVLKFGFLIQPSILETLPTTIPLHFAAVFVALQLCLSSAVSNSALYQHMEDCMDISRDFNHRRCVLRTTLTLFAILIAEIVPRFDLVMSLIGGTLTGPLVFILPPLFYIRMISMRSDREKELAMESFTSIVNYDSGEKSSFELAKYRDDRFRAEIIEDDRKIPWEKIEIVLCVFIVILSACCTLATTFVNLRSAVKYSNFSQPCIYNVSSALLDL